MYFVVICGIICIVEVLPYNAKRRGISMPIIYRIDVMAALKEKGYSSYKLRKEKLLGEATMTDIRKGQIVSLENLTRLCKLLECQPGDILEYVP